MRELGASQIHLWHYPVGAPPDPQHLAIALTLLSDPEKKRRAAFHVEKHADEYALSHAMLRLALSEYAPVKPRDWQFLAREHGKPEIAAPALDTSLWFNLSHTDGCAVCVITRIPTIGVDVENVNRRASYLELAQRFFAPVESEYLRSLPASLQRAAFFRIWTLKEAYIKADGRGLAIPLNSFWFRFPSDHAELEPDPGHWSFFEQRIEPDYQVSIGVNNPGKEILDLQRLDASALFARL